MAKSAKWRRSTGIGCLTLFALPFAGVGIATTWWSFDMVQQHAAMKSWVEAPANIREAELKVESGEGTSYRAVATYDYIFGGKNFVGERVTIHQGSDNIGGFQRRAYEELKRCKDTHKPFRCYVNPAKPDEAVLYRNLRGEMLMFYTLFATLFGSVGLTLLIAAIMVGPDTPKPPAEETPADEPWLANPEWSGGRIREAAGTAVSVPALAVAAVYWNVATLPLVIALREVLSQDLGFWRFVPFVFLAAGVGLVLIFFHQLFGLRKFGTSVFQMAGVPGVVGGQLAGVIQIPRSITASVGFRLKLSCVETTGAGDNKKEVMRWQAERLVAEPILDADGKTAVPVLFAIPFDCLPTSSPDGKGRVKWRLEAAARMPGVDYKSSFDVPVFMTTDSRPDFKLDEDLAADFAATPPHDMLYREARLSRELLAGGGVRIFFPAARNLSSAISMSVVLTIWTGALWFMISHRIFWLFPIVFGLFEFMILWIVLDLWLYRSMVEATRGGLVGRGGWLGIGRTWSLAPDEIRRLTLDEHMSSGTSVWRNVIVVSKSGKKRVIGKAINSELVQQAIIAELEEALGRRDTQA